MLAEAVKSVKEWFAGWFRSDARAMVVSVLDSVAVFVDQAMPIVEAIDKELKPQIASSHQPVSDIVGKFILARCDAPPLAVWNRAADLQRMPRPDMYVNIALFMLSRASRDNVAASVLRLAIELAYNVFKATRKESSK